MGSGDSREANRVDILQSGGCAGGGCAGGGVCGDARFEGPMDGRLRPYLTQQEYEKVIDEANATARAKGVKSHVWAIGIPFFVIGAVFSALAKGERLKCEAVNGPCEPDQSAATDQCCEYTCCPKTRRLLEGSELGQKLNTSAAAWDFLAPSGTVNDSPRALLSGRRLEAFLCFRDEATDQTECKCREEGSGKNRKQVCDGKLSIAGAHVVEPPVLWPIAVAVPSFVLGFLLCLVYPVWKICVLGSYINPILEPWRRTGLSAEYKPGNKHWQARIIVRTPGNATVVGTVMG
mmetsp:Transcript_40714/g.105326  ORF Transcript_40714/g.105326 Transcript_40714/m.105326 type:complete len:291 (+) Transcript_40714:81-953(+)